MKGSIVSERVSNLMEDNKMFAEKMNNSKIKQMIDAYNINKGKTHISLK